MTRTVAIFGVNKYHDAAIEVDARMVGDKYIVSYKAYDEMRASLPRKGIDDSITFETVHGEPLIPVLLETYLAQDQIVLGRIEENA